MAREQIDEDSPVTTCNRYLLKCRYSSARRYDEDDGPNRVYSNLSVAAERHSSEHLLREQRVGSSKPRSDQFPALWERVRKKSAG